MPKSILTLILTCLVSGCSTLPDVVHSYYPAKWNIVATVTQSIICDSKDTNLIYMNTPSAVINYASDLDKSPYQIKIKNLDGIFADNDFKINFTDDGRLSSINQSSVGQGDSVIKSAVTLAAAIPKWGIASHIRNLLKLEEAAQSSTLSECNFIKNLGGGKPVSIIYKVAIDTNNLGKSIELGVQPDSQFLYDSLKEKLPKLHINVGSVLNTKNGTNYAGNPIEEGGVVLLELQKMGYISITFNNNNSLFGTSKFMVPVSDTYKLPILRSALFGKQSFSIELTDAGAVKSILYGKLSGAANALGAMTAIANLEKDTAVAQAGELSAQSNLIVQQQRALICLNKPVDCK